MNPWDGRFHRWKRNFNHGKGKWVRRCAAIAQGSGGGYCTPHQCTHTAIIKVNDRMLCQTHLRQYLRGQEA